MKTIRNSSLIAKTLALVVVTALLLTAMPVTAYGDYNDVPISHWAYNSIMQWSTGATPVLEGYGDGDFGPDLPIMSRDLDLILNRMLGVSDNQWYASTPITRERAAYQIAIALGVDPLNSPSVRFNDDAAINQQYRPYIYGLVQKGILNIDGIGGRQFGPALSLTRAEVVHICYNALSAIVDYNISNQSFDKTVIIRRPNITLQNVTIYGDLIIGQGAGNSAVTLNGVTVQGRVIIFGGNAVNIGGNSDIDNAVLRSNTFIAGLGTLRNLTVTQDVTRDVSVTTPRTYVNNQSRSANVVDAQGNIVVRYGQSGYTGYGERYYSVTFRVSEDPEETNERRFDVLDVLDTDRDGYVTAPTRYDIERYYRNVDFSGYAFRGWFSDAYGGRKIANAGGYYRPANNGGRYLELFARWEYVGTVEDANAAISGVNVSGTVDNDISAVSAQITLSGVTVTDPARIRNLDVTDWFNNFLIIQKYTSFQIEILTSNDLNFKF